MEDNNYSHTSSNIYMDDDTMMAYSNEKPGVLTETLGVYSEPRGVQGVALYSLRDGISWK